MLGLNPYHCATLCQEQICIPDPLETHSMLEELGPPPMKKSRKNNELGDDHVVGEESDSPSPQRRKKFIELGGDDHDSSSFDDDSDVDVVWGDIPEDFWGVSVKNSDCSSLGSLSKDHDDDSLDRPKDDSSSDVYDQVWKDIPRVWGGIPVKKSDGYDSLPKDLASIIMERENSIFERQWKSSDGFDVDHPPHGFRIGECYLIVKDLASINQLGKYRRDAAYFCAKFAVAEENKKKHEEEKQLEFMELVKFNVDIEGGDEYYLTFQAREGGTTIDKLYQARVEYFDFQSIRPAKVKMFREKPSKGDQLIHVMR